MEARLLASLEALHGDRRGWVYLSTVGANGEPHVAPMMMDFDADVCYFSLTGHHKKENLARDPRCSFALSRAFPSTGHVMVWGSMELRHDAEAQERWHGMVMRIIGPGQGAGSVAPRDRPLSFDKTSFGVFTPYRARIYGLDDAVPAGGASHG